MLKRSVIFFFSLLIAIAGVSQGSRPVINRAGTQNTVQDGAGMWLYNAVMPRFSDTTAANLQKGCDSCGAVIFTYDVNTLWVRQCSPKKWVLISAGGGGGTPGGLTLQVQYNLAGEFAANSGFTYDGQNVAIAATKANANTTAVPFLQVGSQSNARDATYRYGIVLSQDVDNLGATTVGMYGLISLINNTSTTTPSFVLGGALVGSTTKNIGGITGSLGAAEVVNSSGSATVTDVVALSLENKTSNAGTKTITNAKGIQLYKTYTSGAATITNDYGIFLDNNVNGSFASATITNHYGIYYSAPSNGTITNKTAIYLESVGSSQFAINSAGGKVQFASLASGATAPTTTGTTKMVISDQNGLLSFATLPVGTVTSFSAGNLSPLFTTSVATATTTPALTFALTNAGANTYFGNATSGSTAPSYTAAGSLTKVDDANVTLTLGGAPTTSLLASTSITVGWTGQLSVSRGGTGNSSFTAYSVLLGGTTSTGAFQNVSGVGTSGQVLTSNGAGVAPTWQAASSGFTNPMTTLGDVIIGGASGTATRVAGNTTLQKKYFMSQGDASILAQAQSYDQIAATEIKYTAEIPPNDIIDIFGDSFAFGQQASTGSKSWASIVAATTNSLSVSNYAVAGSGNYTAVTAAYTNIGVGNTYPGFYMTGLNDLRASGSNAKSYEKLKSCLRAFIGNNFLKTAVAANDASVTASGSWTTTSGIGDKASSNLGGLVRVSSGAAVTLTYSFTGSTLLVGTFSTDEVITTGGDWTWSMDGGTMTGSYTGKNKTDGVTVSGNNNSIVPNAVFINNIGSGSHTIVITASAANARIDYFATLMSPQECAPVIVPSIPRMNATGYAAAPANGSTLIFNTGSAAYQSVINEYAALGYPAYFIEINDYYTVAAGANNGVGADSIHPNDLGYRQIATGVLNTIRHSSNYAVQNPLQLGTASKGFLANSVDITNLTANFNPVAGTLPVTTKAASAIYLSAAALDGNIKFYTTASNNATPTLRMTLNKDGKLSLNNTNTTYTFDVTGTANVSSQTNIGGGLQVLGALGTPTGSGGLEFEYTSSIGFVTAFDRGGSAWKPLSLRGSTITFSLSGTQVAQMQSTGILIGSSGSAAYNLDVTGNIRSTANTFLASSSGGVFIGGTTTPTAYLHIKAGTATASTAPLKLTQGTNLTTPEIGAIEYDGSRIYFTNSMVTRGDFQVNKVVAANTGSPVTITTNYNVWVWYGTTATYTLPAVSAANTNYLIILKNRGSGNVTLNSNAGGNDIYTSSAVATITIAPGESYTLILDGTYWLVI